MQFKYILPLFALAFAVCLASCEEEKQTSVDNTSTVQPETKPTKKYNVPKFEGDSAYSYVAKQLSFGPRVPNKEGHKAAKEWLVSQFKAFGADVIEQDFQAKAHWGETLNATNIIAQYNPTAKKRIIFAAHWDSRYVADHDPESGNQITPVPGADDGGSGVGVLLEVARQLQANPIDAADLGVDIILYDAEDQGNDGGQDPTSWCLGSQYWSRNLHRPGYRAKYGILLDMVGAKNPRFGYESYSKQYAPQVLNKVWSLAGSMGYSALFPRENTGYTTDDHVPVNEITKIPMIDIINKPLGSETSFVPHWHTVGDDMDAISKRTLRIVGQVMLAVTYREASGTL